MTGDPHVMGPEQHPPDPLTRRHVAQQRSGREEWGLTPAFRLRRRHRYNLGSPRLPVFICLETRAVHNTQRCVQVFSSPCHGIERRTMGLCVLLMAERSE